MEYLDSRHYAAHVCECQLDWTPVKGEKAESARARHLMMRRKRQVVEVGSADAPVDLCAIAWLLRSWRSGSTGSVAAQVPESGCPNVALCTA